jgi:hypothetical protein
MSRMRRVKLLRKGDRPVSKKENVPTAAAEFVKALAAAGKQIMVNANYKVLEVSPMPPPPEHSSSVPPTVKVHRKTGKSDD